MIFVLVALIFRFAIICCRINMLHLYHLFGSLSVYFSDMQIFSFFLLLSPPPPYLFPTIYSNRIEIEVLSVVASQVRVILDAVCMLSVPMNRPREYQNLPAGTPAAKVGTFMFFGDEISLVPTGKWINEWVGCVGVDFFLFNCDIIILKFK